MIEHGTQGYEPIHPGRQKTKAYSVGQIVGGTLLGGPLTGALLLASNYDLFRFPERRRLALVGGVAASIVMIPVLFLLPEATPNTLVPAIYTLVVQQIAQRSQGSRIKSFLEAGGAKHSHWRVFGIGISCLLAFTFVFFLVMLAFPEWIPADAA